ncbi:MAG: response regulator [Anaerolineae bacterium]|nr:response regulator [Anaerolineae bacterium]
MSQAKGKRILVVEDELSIALSLRRALEHPLGGGHHVEISASADTALTRLKRETFDLIVTDLKMPGMSGLDLLKQVHQIAPNARTMLITAFGSDSVEQQAQLLASAYLAKPFNLADFIVTVKELLENEPPKRLLMLHGENLDTLSTLLERLHAETGSNLVLLGDFAGHTIARAGAEDCIDPAVLVEILRSNAWAAQRILSQGTAFDLHFRSEDNGDVYVKMAHQDVQLAVVFATSNGDRNTSGIWVALRHAVDALQGVSINTVTGTYTDNVEKTLATALETMLAQS